MNDQVDDGMITTLRDTLWISVYDRIPYQFAIEILDTLYKSEIRFVPDCIEDQSKLEELQ